MESDTIKDAIDALRRARPCVSQNDDPSSLTNSLGAPISRDTRHLSMKRKSDALPAGKCNCGKCSKCVPSPSGESCLLTLCYTFLLLLFQTGCGMVANLSKLAGNGKCQIHLAVFNQACVV